MIISAPTQPLDQILEIAQRLIGEPKSFVGDNPNYYYDIHDKFDKFVDLLAGYLRYPMPDRETSYDSKLLQKYLESYPPRRGVYALIGPVHQGDFRFVYNNYLKFITSNNYFKEIKDESNLDSLLRDLYFYSLIMRAAFHTPLGYFYQARFEVECKGNYDKGLTYYKNSIDQQIKINNLNNKQEKMLSGIVQLVQRKAKRGNQDYLPRYTLERWIFDVQLNYTIYKSSGHIFKSNNSVINWEDIVEIIKKSESHDGYKPWFSSYTQKDYDEMFAYVIEEFKITDNITTKNIAIIEALKQHRIRRKDESIHIIDVEAGAPGDDVVRYSTQSLYFAIMDWEERNKPQSIASW